MQVAIPAVTALALASRYGCAADVERDRTVRRHSTAGRDGSDGGGEHDGLVGDCVRGRCRADGGVVDATFTFWVRGKEPDASKLASPLYSA